MSDFDIDKHPRHHPSNPGAFSEKANSAPDTGLPGQRAASPGDGAVEARADAAGVAAFLADRESHLANVDLLCATLLDEFPAAVTARFEWDYGDDGFDMVSVVDASGVEIPGAVETSKADDIMSSFGTGAVEYFDHHEVIGGEAITLSLTAAWHPRPRRA